MRRILRKPAIILIAILGPSLLIFFQNCSNASLEAIESPAVILSVPSVDLKANICSEARYSPGETSKFVFIMDLSASNFGNWKSRNIGGQTFYSWDPSQATDATGARFEAVRYFVDNCGNQNGNQFAFIGFSQAAGLLKDNQFSCDIVEFSNKGQMLTQMDALKARQSQDEQWYRRWIEPAYLTEQQPDSLIYSVTSYTSASKCLERLIVDDLTKASGANTDRYNIFFISDGLPQDKNGTGCNKSSLTESQKLQCYLNENLNSITMTRTAALSKGKSLQIQGIYYGNQGGAVPVVLDAISKEGGTSEVLQLQNFSSNPKALCDLVVAQNAIEFRPDLMTFFNLTVKRRGGVLQADSDMDGLTDAEEIALGYDPTHPRSSGVDGILDGICEKLGGIGPCQTRRLQINCASGSYDKLGLSDCDRKALGLDSLPGVVDLGVDSDRDGLPDFVEVVSGTDPGKADTTLDHDGDGVMNRDEILRGSDPFFPDGGLALELQNDNHLSFRAQSSIPACQMGDWEVRVRQMQVARTQAVNSWPSSLSYLNHDRNDQIVLAIYRLTPANSTKPMNEYYARFVKIKASGKIGAEVLTPEKSVLDPQDFLSIGRTQP